MLSDYHKYDLLSGINHSKEKEIPKKGQHEPKANQQQLLSKRIKKAYKKLKEAFET